MVCVCVCVCLFVCACVAIDCGSIVEMCVMRFIVCRSILSGSGWGR